VLLVLTRFLYLDRIYWLGIYEKHTIYNKHWFFDMDLLREVWNRLVMKDGMCEGPSTFTLSHPILSGVHPRLRND